MVYQQLLTPFCFYSLIIILLVQQSQLTVFAFAGKHLCARDDALYLLQFKQGFTAVGSTFNDCDARDKTLSWNVTGDCCEWDGVTCDVFSGHVIGLDLSCSLLFGAIDANNSLAKLGHLERLNLAFNQLDDFPLGNSISELSSLTHLNLSASGFNGGTMIPPGLSELSKLLSLDLSRHYNDLQVGRTTLQSLLRNLTNLEVLLIDNVDGEPAELPTNFSSSLRYLSLPGTNMFGDISDSQLFHLPNLQVLNLARNPLITGTLPNFNWSFSGSILELDFTNTRIVGKLPDSIGNHRSLWYLNLKYCTLSGSIPESFGNLTAMRELTLSYNSFTGNVLSSISKLNKLVHLDLTDNHFQGSFPESIGNLTALRKLTLPFNNFTGVVPSTFSKLNKLVELDLSSNHFRGYIPESIGNLTSIRKLTLSSNNFTGYVPSTLGKLNKLQLLSLSLNNFEGSIPDIFANFSELTELGLGTNNFTGSFPYSIASLTSLVIVELQNNSLTGPLPSNISGLQKLQQLDLSFNHFTGATPPWLFHRSWYLYLQHNQFTGKLPNERKSNYSSFVKLDLSYNKLYGEIPDWILSMSDGLAYLDLSHNFLTGFGNQVWRSEYLFYLNLGNNFLRGPLHQSICDMINLQLLILAQNNFSGSIPGCLGNSSSRIAILDLRMNKFHGEIPRFLPTGLQYLGLYGNQFGGQVPQSLVNCTSLQALDLGNNKINDTFPIWLEKLPNLQVMILKSNLFHGPIGDLESEFPFPELRIFDLSFNGFTGTLPSNLFKSSKGMLDVDEEKAGTTRDRISWDYPYHVSLTIKGNEFDMRITPIMTSIDLSSNRFEGDIPNSIGSLSSLVLLNVSHNNFRGYIPEEIAKLHDLEALDLSWNKLTGEIPGQLSSLTFLAVLNLSYNHLAGRIPLGKQFNTFSNDSYYGNPDLCGFPLSMECGNNNVSDESDDDDDDESFFASGFSWQSVVIGYGCGMIFGLFIGGLMCLLDKPNWFVNFAEDIAQQIVDRKRTRQKKRCQRHGLRMT
ncbi:receptor-like protein 43 [Capsicum chacoense]